MHKTSYASGFLYHLPSEQILLLQKPSSSQTASWLLFGRPHDEDEEPEVVFKKVVSESLGIDADPVETVYSYFHEGSKTNRIILYHELKKLRDFPPKNGFVFKWFSFKEVIKLPLSEQTKHDLVVSKRVIDATARKTRGEFTSPH